jgi:hypothetical protein
MRVISSQSMAMLATVRATSTQRCFVTPVFSPDRAPISLGTGGPVVEVA